MYMADGTATETETGHGRERFYSDIISSSAVCTIMCDSIQFDEHERKFTYYGTQLIKRRTRDIRRSMVTTGYIESVPRTRTIPTVCSLPAGGLLKTRIWTIDILIL